MLPSGSGALTPCESSTPRLDAETSILQFSCDVYKTLFPLPQLTVNMQSCGLGASSNNPLQPHVIRFSGKALDPHGGREQGSQDSPPALLPSPGSWSHTFLLAWYHLGSYS